MSNELLDVMRIANREFQEFIEHVAQNDAKVVESRGAVRRLDKVDLLLKRVSKILAAVSPSSLQSPDAANEILKYRENLKTLRSVMETLQFSLQAEKARMESVRSNLQAAGAWATSLREIS
jgi:DNA repair exonuclease SbcCD ATPase subunit